MNEIEKIEQALEESLEDFVMSRSERKGLKKLIREIQGDARRVASVRQLAFRLAGEKMGESHIVMDWLQGVIKVLYASETKVKNRAYFSPGTDCLNEIIHFITSAQKSIDLCVFTITDNRIVRRIEETHEKGVSVRIISDNDKSRDLGADTQRMMDQGIPTRLDITDAHMHHKFALADGDRLLSGSYNWTRAACAENSENIVVTDEPSLVSQFVDEFEKLWTSLA